MIGIQAAPIVGFMGGAGAIPVLIKFAGEWGKQFIKRPQAALAQQPEVVAVGARFLVFDLACLVQLDQYGEKYGAKRAAIIVVSCQAISLCDPLVGRKLRLLFDLLGGDGV